MPNTIWYDPVIFFLIPVDAFAVEKIVESRDCPDGTFAREIMELHFRISWKGSARFFWNCPEKISQIPVEMPTKDQSNSFGTF